MLLSESCCRRRRINTRHRAGEKWYTHFAVLVIVVPYAEQKLERLLVSQNGGPGERGVPLVVWIRISHLCPLDQSLDEKEIVLCMHDEHGTARGGMPSEKADLSRLCGDGQRRPFLPWRARGRERGREGEAMGRRESEERTLHSLSGQ